MKQQKLEESKEYKYGFVTDIESIKAPKGLNEKVIKFISKEKKEPKWMLDWRLKAFNRLKNLKEPNWQKPKYPKINYQDLYYYSAPKSSKDNPKSWSHVRVATKYPNITKNYFAERGVQAECLKLNGALEIAPMLGLTKRIVDLVSTGKTLQENGLSEVEKIMDISSYLIVNRNISKSKPERIKGIIKRFRKAVNAKNS